VKELAFQTKVIQAIKAQGGDGYKSNNRFLANILDLSMVLPPHGHFYVECKVANLSRLVDPIITWTEGQRNWGLRWQSLGCTVLICVLLRETPKRMHVWASDDLTLERVPRAVIGNNPVVNGRGWNTSIMAAIEGVLTQTPRRASVVGPT
jgi:hypothetical protein